jgi:hypothetical protein
MTPPPDEHDKEPTQPHMNGVNGSNGAIHDADDDDDGADVESMAPLAEEEITPAPEKVLELAASCVRYVATKYGAALDFAPDTLSYVDQYIRDARSELMTSALAGQTLDLLSATVGAYLGEVIRIAFGGNWYLEGEHDGWRLDMSRVFLTFNPIGMAREALLLGEAEGWHGHLETDDGEREGLESRLKSLPEVSDDEFYAPSTRFDVVEIAVEALVAKMRANALGDVRFTSEDYRKK